MSLVDSVNAGLDALAPLDVRDQAAADLALAYALAIDYDEDGKALAEYGPKLLQSLASLGMTPSARKNVSGDKPEPAKRNPLDELRARRAARTAT